LSGKIEDGFLGGLIKLVLHGQTAFFSFCVGSGKKWSGYPSIEIDNDNVRMTPTMAPIVIITNGTWIIGAHEIEHNQFRRQAADC